ncbi:MAG: hypothetical protein HYY25_14695 [Candidatus Wallbacteria bacterium]|nr:hypothetical protein [Candidatus Wallbacteria bacterium]
MDRAELQQLEEERAREVVGIVDSAILRIMNKRMTRDEALELVAEVRRRVTEIFPGSEGTFDLIYLGRFQRTIAEYVGEE